MGTNLIVLGSGQDGGAPQLGNRSSVSPARSASSVAILGSSGAIVLLDASPDIRLQVKALLDSPLYPENRERFIDAVCVTHAHMGHHAGLLHFGVKAAATRETPLFATECFLSFMEGNEPWASLLSQGRLRGTPIDHNLAIKSIPVPHREEHSDTVAFSVEVRREPWLLYLPDLDDWDTWEAGESQLSRHDVALIDASFSSLDEVPGRDMAAIRHPLIPDTIQRFRHLTEETQLILTHINHSNPLGDDTAVIAHQAIAAGFTIAHDGLTISFEEIP